MVLFIRFDVLVQAITCRARRVAHVGSSAMKCVNATGGRRSEVWCEVPAELARGYLRSGRPAGVGAPVDRASSRCSATSRPGRRNARERRGCGGIGSRVMARVLTPQAEDFPRWYQDV